ncbi:MAG: AI-2E family transporter [Armatimonadia bacterium]
MTTRIWWQAVGAIVVGLCITLVLRWVFINNLTVFTLFALGWLVAWVMDPLLDAMERRRMPRVVAVWMVTLGFLVIIAVTGILIVPLVVAQVQDAAANWREYSATGERTYQVWRQHIEAYAQHRLPNVDVTGFFDAKVTELTTWLGAHVPTMLQWVSQGLLASVGVVGAAAFLLIISFHFMNVIDPLRRSIKAMLPPSADREMEQVGTQINRMLGQYLRGIILVSVMAGLSATLLLSIIGFLFHTKYALIIGIITGVTYVIPYLGPLISALSAGFFGYVTSSGVSPWLPCLASIGAMYAVNQVFDNAVTPRVVGQKVGLHPLVILFAAMAGFSLFGIPGMIIATPAAASIKILMARWLPIKGMDFAAPCTKRKLEIDLPASINLVGRSVVKLGKDIEGVLRHSEEIEQPPDQEKLPLEGVEEDRDVPEVRAEDE